MLFSRRVSISRRSSRNFVWAFKIWIPNEKATLLSREHVSSQTSFNYRGEWKKESLPRQDKTTNKNYWYSQIEMYKDVE